jgi:hypothetical protein
LRIATQIVETEHKLTNLRVTVHQFPQVAAAFFFRHGEANTKSSDFYSAAKA